MRRVCPDPAAVTDFLRKFFIEGDVFEIRALEATCPGYRRPHIESGYFDYDHIDQVGAAVSRLSFAKGIYYTSNPVQPSLLARASNRIRPAGTNPTTKDSEIVCRRWLLIDCDPIRPAGISSTDAEHELALDRAKTLRANLTQFSWPQPIFCDSGNGAQLMYRIDLSCNDTGKPDPNDLIKRVLAILAQHDDDKVKVDQVVYNPSRIWRLPGTMNCRGDHVPERPHRLARVIDLPDELNLVTKDQLEALAGFPVSSSSKQLPSSASATSLAENRFELAQWIATYCPDTNTIYLTNTD